MALNELNTELDSKYIKSYATESGLRKALNKLVDLYSEYNDRSMVVRTPAGRWTAIIITDKTIGGYVSRYDGFLKI